MKMKRAVRSVVLMAAMVAGAMVWPAAARAQCAFTLLVDQTTVTAPICQGANVNISATAPCSLPSETQINLSATVNPPTGLTVSIGGGNLPTFTAYNNVHFDGTVVGMYTVTITGTGTGSRLGQTSSVQVIVNVTAGSGCGGGGGGFPTEEQACPCAAAKNHGQYVSCVTHWAKEAHQRGFISESDRKEAVEAAAHSACGKKDHEDHEEHDEHDEH